MKTKLFYLASLVFVLLLSFMVVSCEDDIIADLTGIETQGFTADGGVYKTVLPSSTEYFDANSGLLAKIGMKQGAEYKLYTDKACTKELKDFKVKLNPGDNFLYLRVRDVSEHQKDYTFNIYKKMIYTVTYKLNGGSMEHSTATVEEGTVLHSPQASKTGYVLSWDYDFSKPITSNITINAIWTPADRVIETDVNGVLTKYDVKYGEIPSIIPTPSKDKYTFVGWMYGEVVFDVSKPISFDAETITITAVFAPVSYNIQYILNGATINPNPGSISAEDGIITLLAPEFAKHKFGGWYTSAAFDSSCLVTEITAAEGIVLHAKWNYVSTVTFDANDGDCDVETKEFTNGEAYVLPSEVTREGYTFVGWYDGQTLVNNSGTWSMNKDVTLVAKWVANITEIEYVLGIDGVTNSNPTSLDILTEDIELVNPVVNGKFAFAGWYLDAKFTEESKVTHITADMAGKKVTFYAKWNTISTVTFDADGGTVDPETQDIIFGDSYKLPIPSKDGCEFAGWYNGDAQINAEGVWSINGDVTLVAKWSVVSGEKDKINYVLGYEDVTNNNPVEYDGKTEIKLVNPVHKNSEKYTFIGWYKSADFSEDSRVESLTPDMVGSDVTLFAKWSITYVVSLDNNGEVTTFKATYGSAYTLPELTLLGYTFNGWFNGTQKIDSTGIWSIPSDVTLVASFTLNSYNIKYILGYDALVNNNPASFDITSGTIVLYPIAFDEKHEFGGWFLDAELTEAISEITADMIGNDLVLYAKWNIKSTVQFDVNGGVFDVDPLEEIYFGAAYELPTPTREHYEFIGWYDSEGTRVDINGTSWRYGAEGVTLIADWEETEYGINYNLNGGTANVEYPSKYTVSSPADLLASLASPTKQFATFVGWFVDQNCTQSLEGYDYKTYESLTIYAKWEDIKVIFNFDTDNDEKVDSLEFSVGSQYVLPTPSRAGYDFLGWYNGNTKFELSGKWTDTSVLEITLVARWSEPLEYTITYDFDGGSVSGTLVEKYTVLSEIILPKPTKAGYHFVGWSLNGGTASPSVVIKNSIGDLTIKAVWTNLKDTATGLLFSVVGENQVSVSGIERVIASDIKNGIKIPSTFAGYTVVAIESNAFKAFGEEFTKTEYANLSSSYVTISLPTTIRKVGANAFKTCNGIKISLYDPDPSVKYADYKAWDALVEWEDGNKAARDCVWGFRPAIGWTRYSKVEIPEGYDYLKN